MLMTPCERNVTPRSRSPRCASRSPSRRPWGPKRLDDVFDSVARYFSLLAEPTRLKILHTICHDERSVSSIVAATGATQTNVSRHLSLMHQAGVVSRRRDGSTVFYKVLDPEFAEICRTVCVRIAGRIEAGEPLKRELLDFAAAR